MDQGKRNSEHKIKWLRIILCWIAATYFLITFFYHMGVFFPDQPCSWLQTFYLLLAIFLYLIPFIKKFNFGNVGVELKEGMHVPGPGEGPEPEKGPEPEQGPELEKGPEPEKPEKEEKVDIAFRRPSFIELKILNTLWNRQVNKFPDLKCRFTFIVKGDNDFAEAGGQLLAQGMIAKTSDGQYYLTNKGAKYCAKNYKEFPPDMWFKKQPINEENVKIIMKKLSLKTNES